MKTSTRCAKTRTALGAAIVAACALATSLAIGVGIAVAAPAQSTVAPVGAAQERAKLRDVLRRVSPWELQSVRRCAIKRLAAQAIELSGDVGVPAPGVVNDAVLECTGIVLSVSDATATLQSETWRGVRH